MLDKIKLFKALADQSRIRIVQRLIESPMYVEALSERLELAPSTVSFHLKKLLDAGLVEKEKDQYYVLYSIKEDILGMTLSRLLEAEKEELDQDDEREEQYRQKVLDTFFEFDKLKSIPVQRKKRKIILDKIVEAFEEDHVYSEREVNIVIADYHDDFATLRREMIAEKLLVRENNQYWRLRLSQEDSSMK